MHKNLINILQNNTKVVKKLFDLVYIYRIFTIYDRKNNGIFKSK